MFDKMFNFGDISNFVQTLTSAATQTNEADKELAEQTAKEKAEAVRIADQYNQTAQKSLDRLQTVNAKGDEARRLAESDNIFDRITLIGEQMINPRDYTADGRSRQISEMSQSLAAEGQMHNVALQASEARVAEAAAIRDIKVINATSKTSILKAQVNGLALANDALVATESLRQNMLTQQDLPTIQKALASAPDQKGDSKVSIGGMQYSQTELRERAKNLEVRAQLSMLSPQATDPDYAQKVAVHQDLQLANYSIPELEALRANKYVMPDGSQVQPQLFDVHFQRQTQQQQQVLQTQMNKFALEQQVPTMLKESDALAMNLQTFAQAGSPLAVARNNFIAVKNQVEQLAASDTTPNGKMLAVDQLQKAQTQLVGAVEAEAKRRAGGDQQLAGIYRNQMLGQEVNSAQVQDVVRARYIKGGTFSDFLPPEMATRLKKSADANFELLQKQGASNLDPMAPNRSRKDMQEEAVQMALEKEEAESGTRAINIIQQHAVTRMDNPAVKANVFTPIELQSVSTRATQMAQNDAMKREKLTPQQMAALIAGEPEREGISKERARLINQQINDEAVFNEYDLFEQKKPGLGYEMQQWYSKVLPEMAQTYTSRSDPMEAAIAGSGALLQANKAIERYARADESATARSSKQLAELATGAKRPENMWPVLLQMQTQLADSQKQMLYYDVIAPAIQAARSNGANDKVASDAAFKALMDYKSDDSATMSALKTLQRNMPDELDKFYWVWGGVMNKDQGMLKGMYSGSYPETAARQINRAFPWMNKE